MTFRSAASALFIFLAAVSILGGCSTVTSVSTTVAYSVTGTVTKMTRSTENMVRDFRAPDTDLKKTVFIATLDNQAAAAKQDVGEEIGSLYLEVLTKSCPDLLFVGADNAELSASLNRLFEPSTGPFDSLSLIRIGKQSGLSAVVHSRFFPVAIRKKDTGFLWFLKKRPFAWISATVAVYDTETGAKYLDQTFTRELKLKEDEDAESIQKGAIRAVPEVEKAVFEIVQEMADAVNDALIRRPWKCYVLKVSEGTLTLSAGSRTGLSTGRALKVYEPGPRMEGPEGQVFLMPGKKIGEIKILAVSDDNAEAAVLSGSGFQMDDVVKTR